MFFLYCIIYVHSGHFSSNDYFAGVAITTQLFFSIKKVNRKQNISLNITLNHGPFVWLRGKTLLPRGAAVKSANENVRSLFVFKNFVTFDQRGAKKLKPISKITIYHDTMLSHHVASS